MSSTSWWFRILLITALISHTAFSRHIEAEDQDEDSVDSELEAFTMTDIEDFIGWLEDRLHDEMREEEALIELATLEKQNAEESKEEEFRDFKGKALLKVSKELDSDYFSDSADYMGDAPENPVAESKKEKVIDFIGDANISWPFVQTNGSAEDPVMVKEQRESIMDPEALIRSKELRLSSIRSTILELRKGNSAAVNGSFPSTKTLQEMFELNRDFQPHISTTSYTEKLQSFYPSCKTPNHTDDEMWSDANLMHILFNLTYPTPSVGTGIQVMGAKLRLYKKSYAVNDNSSATEVGGASSRPVKTEKPGFNQAFSLQSNDGSAEDERLLRVSVYWYTRALKKNRAKRKLLDSQMFTVHGELSWIELNIRTAVRFWRESGRNHGLVVTVEDEDGIVLPAIRYLHTMNCSKEAANAKPLPSFVEDAAKQYMQHQHPETNQSSAGHTVGAELYPFPDFLYPKLDICTIEVPLTDTRQIPETSCLNIKKTPEPIPNDLFKFRNETATGPAVSKRQGNETRGTFFNMVGLGSPSSGPNRNALVPILTKSDVVTAPEDDRMRNELMRVQTEAPRLRHGRKHSSNSKNETN